MNNSIELDNFVKTINWEDIYEKAKRDALSEDEFKLYVLSFNCCWVSDLQPGDIVRAYGLPYRMVVNKCLVTMEDGSYYYLDDEPLNAVRCTMMHRGKKYRFSFPPLQLELIERPGKSGD